jgi:hypothetical protein
MLEKDIQQHQNLRVDGGFPRQSQSQLESNSFFFLTSYRADLRLAGSHALENELLRHPLFQPLDKLLLRSQRWYLLCNSLGKIVSAPAVTLQSYRFLILHHHRHHRHHRHHHHQVQPSPATELSFCKFHRNYGGITCSLFLQSI